MRLDRHLDANARPWPNPQTGYDLRVAEIAVAEKLRLDVRPLSA